MNSNLIWCEKLEIPEALTQAHELLRSELIRAAREPGPIGKAAERVAQLCLPHFSDEEEHVFRAIGLLHDVASDRMRSDMAGLTPMIAKVSAKHLAMRDQHQPINAAVEELLQVARKVENQEIVELVGNFRDHEKIENEVMYPTLLFIDRSVRESLGD